MSVSVSIVVGAMLLFFYLRGLHTQKSLPGIPGPQGVPVFGNLLHLLRKPVHLVVREWALTYGPVFQFDLLGKQVVAVTGHEALREMLFTRGPVFGGRLGSQEKIKKGSKDLFPTGGLAAEDVSSAWREKRKKVHGALKHYGSGLADFEPVVSHFAEDLIAVFQSKQNKPFDCFDDLCGTLTAFMCTLMSGRFVSRSEPAVVRFGNMAPLLMKDGIFSRPELITAKFTWLRRFSRGHIVTAMQAEREYAEFWKKLCIPLKKSEEFNAGQGILAYMFQTKTFGRNDSEADPSKCIDEDVYSLTRIIMVPGVMTTLLSLYALLNIFLHYPEVQERIAEEFFDKIGPDGKVILEHKAVMPYTRATVLELLRFTSILPHSIFHKAMVDTQVQGYHIPKGTVVIPCQYAHHWNNSEWDEPAVFKPERFLDENGELLSPDDPVRKKLLPFGAGTRTCPGEVLALNRLFIFIASMAQKFKFIPPKDELLVRGDPNTWSLYNIFFQPLRYSLCAVSRNSSP